MFFSHLLIGPLPKAAQDEYNGNRRLQVCADRLDVDEKLASLTGLDDWDPQHRHDHQHQHKDPVWDHRQIPNLKNKKMESNEIIQSLSLPSTCPRS